MTLNLPKVSPNSKSHLSGPNLRDIHSGHFILEHPGIPGCLLSRKDQPWNSHLYSESEESLWARQRPKVISAMSQKESQSWYLFFFIIVNRKTEVQAGWATCSRSYTQILVPWDLKSQARDAFHHNEIRQNRVTEKEEEVLRVWDRVIVVSIFFLNQYAPDKFNGLSVIQEYRMRIEWELVETVYSNSVLPLLVENEK